MHSSIPRAVTTAVRTRSMGGEDPRDLLRCDPRLNSVIIFYTFLHDVRVVRQRSHMACHDGTNFENLPPCFRDGADAEETFPRWYVRIS